MYRKIYFVILFLFPVIKVFSTVNEPLSLEVGIGYRQDNLNWQSLTDTPSEILCYQEKCENRNFLDNNLTLRVINRDIFVLAEGGFASLGRGKLRQLYDNLSFTSDQPVFYFNTSGYDGSLTGLFGLAVNLTPDRIDQWILIPYIGYSGYWNKVRRDDPSPESLQLSDPSEGMTSAYLKSSLNHDLEQIWHGFGIGAEVIFEPNALIFFRFDYIFHWLKLYHKSVAELERQEYSDSTLSTDIFYTQDEKVTNASAFGHIVKARALTNLRKNMLLALAIKYHYFASDKKDHLNKEIDTNQVLPTESTSVLHTKDKFISRWWFLSYVLEFTYRF